MTQGDQCAHGNDNVCHICHSNDNGHMQKLRNVNSMSVCCRVLQQHSEAQTPKTLRSFETWHPSLFFACIRLQKGIVLLSLIPPAVNACEGVESQKCCPSKVKKTDVKQKGGAKPSPITAPWLHSGTDSAPTTGTSTKLLQYPFRHPPPPASPFPAASPPAS